MADNDAFDIISSVSSKAIYPDFVGASSGKVADLDVQLNSFLRSQYPDLNLTTLSANNVPLIPFAQIGGAIAELDTDTESIHRWRGYYRSSARGGSEGLTDAIFFAKYHYKWGYEDFIVYTVSLGYAGQLQYVLKEPGENETPVSNCAKTDALIKACVAAFSGNDDEYIYVFDGYWTRSKELWEQVRDASWDNVILDQKKKDALVKVSTDFFDSKETYEQYGVSWKRGIIFHGEPGNGKTLSVKALMHSLYERKDPKPRLLYVKAAPQTYQIGNVFALARAMSPCLLVMEDIETIVTPYTRAYAFNEMDGLQNNSGIFMLATTNYLERLDPGLSKRPSRFDRKYLFPRPDSHERELYAEYWRSKLAKAPTKIPFPQKLCPAIADITEDFSFAYMQEAFIATLLAIARDSTDETSIFDDSQDIADLAAHFEGQQLSNKNGGGPVPSHPELDGYKLWRAMKAQVKVLRQDMDTGEQELSGSTLEKRSEHPRDLFPIQHDRSGTSHQPSQSPQVPEHLSTAPKFMNSSHYVDAATGVSMPSVLTSELHQPMTRSSVTRPTHLPEYSGDKTFEAQQARAASPAFDMANIKEWQRRAWANPHYK